MSSQRHTQLCAYLNIPTVMPAYSALITNINTIQLRAPMAARGRRERKGERERKRERERERERERRRGRRLG